MSSTPTYTCTLLLFYTALRMRILQCMHKRQNVVNKSMGVTHQHTNRPV
jgi:hypothetical protein